MLVRDGIAAVARLCPVLAGRLGVRLMTVSELVVAQTAWQWRQELVRVLVALPMVVVVVLHVWMAALLR